MFLKNRRIQSLCFEVGVLANQTLGFWAFKTFTSVRETAAAFSMFLTDWKVFFQVPCFRALAGKVGQLFSQQPWPLQLLLVEAFNGFCHIWTLTNKSSEHRERKTEGKEESQESGCPVFQVVAL